MNSRFSTLLVMIALSGVFAGCSSWPGEDYDLGSYDPSKLRDQRAVEIENRLAHRNSPINNPFSDLGDSTAKD